MNITRLTSQPSNALKLKQGLSIIRKVIQSHSTSAGFTTTELYRLALKDSSSLKPGQSESQSHPISSKTFMKRAILPMLEGRREIQLVRTTRLPTRPSSAPTASQRELPLHNQKHTKSKHTSNNSNTKQGKAAPASPPPASPINVWVWKPVEKARISEVVVKRANTIGVSSVGPREKVSGIGEGEDWGHMSKRRQRARIAKTQRELV